MLLLNGHQRLLMYAQWILAEQSDTHPPTPPVIHEPAVSSTKSSESFELAIPAVPELVDPDSTELVVPESPGLEALEFMVPEVPGLIACVP